MNGEAEASLDSIGVRFGTAKSSLKNNYLAFYEPRFQALRNDYIKILEIGVFGGASLRTWYAYFPNAQIVGVDTSRIALGLAGDRIDIEIADQANVQELTDVAAKHGPFDIVIDDGSGIPADQLLAIKTLFPFVKSDGIYIVENLEHNSYIERDSYRGTSETSSIEFLKALLGLHVAESLPMDVVDPFLRTYAKALSSLSFANGTCILKKDYKSSKVHEDTGLRLPTRDSETRYALLKLSVHISNIGDVDGTDAGVHSGSPQRAIQGFTVEPFDQDEMLEYRVRFADESWTEWQSKGSYAGTKGHGRPITGFAIRVGPDQATPSELEYVGLFKDEAVAIKACGGADCVGKNGAILYALQINLRR